MNIISIQKSHGSPSYVKSLLFLLLFLVLLYLVSRPFRVYVQSLLVKSEVVSFRDSADGTFGDETTAFRFVELQVVFVRCLRKLSVRLYL